MLLSTIFLSLLFAFGLITKRFLKPKPQSPEKQSTVVFNGYSSADDAGVGGGNYSKVELTQLKGVFATFDRNKDGFITKQELKESLKNIGIIMDDSEIAEMVQRVDENNDGLVDLDEFGELCNSFLGVRETVENGHDDERDLKEAFDVFDGDRDGLISEEELSRVLSCLGLSEGKRLEACKEMITSVDVDGDGMVNFDEFKRMMIMRGASNPLPIPVS